MTVGSMHGAPPQKKQGCVRLSIDTGTSTTEVARILRIFAKRLYAHNNKHRS